MTYKPNIDQACQVIQPLIILTFSKEFQDILTKLVRLMLLINEKLYNLQ